MSKVWIATPSFCKSAMLKQCLEHFYTTPPQCEFEHLIIYNHYPIDEERNGEEIQKLAKQFGCTFIDSGYDIGLHHSLNLAFNTVKPNESDLWMGNDPDDRGSAGWVEAIGDVLKEAPWIAVVGLNFSVPPWKQKEFGAWPEATVAGHRLWIHPGVEMFNMIGLRVSMIHEMGGFSQPNAYYGGIEIDMFRDWFSRGKKLAYLIDHSSEAASVDRNDPELYDPSYGEWKIDHATRGYRHSFAQWLDKK